MNKKLLLIVAGAVAAIAIAIALLFPGEGELRVEVNQLSPIQDNISVYLASKRHPGELIPPATIKIRAGKYELVAIAPGAASYKQAITIKAGQTTTVSLTLTAEVIQVDQQEITPTQEELENPLYKLFPHNSTNYMATASFTRDETGALVIAEITITPYLPISAGGGYDEAEVARAKEQYVAEAKAWLKENGVPDTTPIVVDSVY